MKIDQDILNAIPPHILELRANRQLHKVAEARTGIDDFGLDSAVTFIAKKAYYARHINKAIASAINAVDTIGS
jgi:hypothetical protein